MGKRIRRELPVVTSQPDAPANAVSKRIYNHYPASGDPDLFGGVYSWFGGLGDSV